MNEVFTTDHQTEWSKSIIERRSLPDNVPELLESGMSVPVAFCIDKDFAAVLILSWWESSDDPIDYDVDIFQYVSSEWVGLNMIGGSWPFKNADDYKALETFDKSIFVRSSCSTEGLLGDDIHADFTVGLVKEKCKGVVFMGDDGQVVNYPKMLFGTFIIPGIHTEDDLREMI